MKMKELPSEHLLAPGTSTCAGCGGLAVVHQLVDLIGPNTVIVNAAGCMTLLATYPFTPFRGSWLFTSMASSPAGAQGIRDALDILIEKERIPQTEDLHVIVLAGDGSSYGMGLSATSSAIERGLDFWYLCYDNQGYGNTGQQTSEATPPHARTSTNRSGPLHPKKDLFAVWTAHEPSYAATIVAAEPVDLAEKVNRAKQIRGPKLFLSLAPCPTGWEAEPSQSIEIGKLAVRTGIWPLMEYVNGISRLTKTPDKFAPVELYLELQGRYRHLFHPVRDEASIAAVQADVDRWWKEHAPARPPTP